MSTQYDNIDEFDPLERPTTAFNRTKLGINEPIDAHQAEVSYKLSLFKPIASKPKLLKLPNDRVTCTECGKVYTRSKKRRHENSVYHHDRIGLNKPSSPIYSTKRKLSDLYTQPNTTSLFIKH